MVRRADRLFQTIPNLLKPGPGAVVIQFSSWGATCANRSNRLIPEPCKHPPVDRNLLARPITDQAAHSRKFPEMIDGRQAVLCGQHNEVVAF